MVYKECTWTLLLMPFLKQIDGYSCGPIACLKFMEMYHAISQGDIEASGKSYRQLVFEHQAKMISNLKSQLLVSKRVKKDKFKKDSEVMCLCVSPRFTSIQKTVQECCNVTFHSDCLGQYLTEATTCPYCEQPTMTSGNTPTAADNTGSKMTPAGSTQSATDNTPTTAVIPAGNTQSAADNTPTTDATPMTANDKVCEAMTPAGNTQSATENTTTTTSKDKANDKVWAAGATATEAMTAAGNTQTADENTPTNTATDKVCVVMTPAPGNTQAAADNTPTTLPTMTANEKVREESVRKRRMFQDNQAIKMMKRHTDNLNGIGKQVEPGGVVTIYVDPRVASHARGVTAVVVACSNKGAGGIIACTSKGIIVNGTTRNEWWIAADGYRYMSSPDMLYSGLSPDLLIIQKAIIDGSFDRETHPKCTLGEAHQQTVGASSPCKRGDCKCKNGRCTKRCGCWKNKISCASTCSCSGTCAINPKNDNNCVGESKV